MNPNQDVIARMYDSQSQKEWDRMDRHRTEFAVTLKAMAEYLPKPPARILDCGGGPGRYAIELTRQGYQVTLFDLSAEELSLARIKAQEAGVDLEAYLQGSATDLSGFAPGSFDIVLLMGPLYHLLELEQRQRAVIEARRVLKPGGMLLATFITRYSGHRYAAREEADWILRDEPASQELLETGRLPPRPSREGGFVAYMAHPTEAAPLIWENGLELVTLLGVEGLVSMIEDQVNAQEGELWERWVELNYHLSSDPALHAGVEHLLAVAVRPRWQAVLRQLADRLAQAGLGFTVVGGTSAALQGVWLPVRDLDLEMDIPSVYRFQELFSAQAVLPVGWREDEKYRSHYGRFDFDGVVVEVMADLQWRQGENWIPVATRNHRQVEVEGASVSVSWLEEETLAYLRRGRLERAAQCLSRCDPQRMSRLVYQQLMKDR
ncbi:MAG: methyltransferase domain-containing protein [Anaerolineales bacterium]|nr:methyltransferase domain-containing protein [Anaerolineales bacterium]